MRRIGSVIAYLKGLDLERMGFCGYLLTARPDACVKKEKKCPKYQEKSSLLAT
jgi:hypothetical protein